MKQRLKMIEAIKLVLKGIDQTEIESEDGWWETSDGAEFGAKKLAYILGLLAQPASYKQSTTCGEPVIDKSAAIRIATALGWKSQSEFNAEYCRGRDDGFEAGRLSAKPEQEPVAWPVEAQPDGSVIPIDPSEMTAEQLQRYTTPYVATPRPQRTWEGLSVFEINDLMENTEYEDYWDLVERTEAKLKEKNTHNGGCL